MRQKPPEAASVTTGDTPVTLTAPVCDLDIHTAVVEWPVAVVETASEKGLVFASDLVTNMCRYLPCVKFDTLICLVVVVPVNCIFAILYIAASIVKSASADAGE